MAQELARDGGSGASAAAAAAAARAAAGAAAAAQVAATAAASVATIRSSCCSNMSPPAELSFGHRPTGGHGTEPVACGVGVEPWPWASPALSAPSPQFPHLPPRRSAASFITCSHHECSIHHFLHPRRREESFSLCVVCRQLLTMRVVCPFPSALNPRGPSTRTCCCVWAERPAATAARRGQCRVE